MKTASDECQEIKIVDVDYMGTRSLRFDYFNGSDREKTCAVCLYYDKDMCGKLNKKTIACNKCTFFRLDIESI